MPFLMLHFFVLWFCSFSTVIQAAGVDSNADADRFFGNIRKSRGLILRVPISTEGEENTGGTMIRLFYGQFMIDKHTNPENIWELSFPIEESEVITHPSRSEDSSTWGWSPYAYGFWATPYFYSGYRPYYFYYNSVYPYSLSPPLFWTVKTPRHKMFRYYYYDKYF